jgi:hypothetical protein
MVPACLFLLMIRDVAFLDHAVVAGFLEPTFDELPIQT